MLSSCSVTVPKRRVSRTRLDGVITHATVMKCLLPLKHTILYGNQRSSGYHGLLSQGIRQPECEANRLPPAAADVSYPAPYVCCTVQLSLTRDIVLPLSTPMLPMGFLSCHCSQRTCQNEHRCELGSNPFFFLLGGIALKSLPEHRLYWWIFLVFLSCSKKIRGDVWP